MTGWLAFVLSGGPVVPPSGTSFTTPTTVPTHPGVYISAPGLDIGSLLGILLPLVVCAIAVLTYRDVKMTQRQKKASADIKNAVEGLAKLLSEKLETKENVALVRVDMAKLKSRVDTLMEVVRELDRKVDAVRARKP